MAMSLSATEFDVLETTPAEFGVWITGEDVADALVLDLENPRLAVAAVTNLRANAKLAPVLLVSSGQPGWDDPTMGQLPGAVVLPLPVSRTAMLAALEDLVSAGWADRLAVPPQHAEVTEALHELVDTNDLLLVEDDPLDDLLTTALEPSSAPGHAGTAGGEPPPTNTVSTTPFVVAPRRRHRPGSHRRTGSPPAQASAASPEAEPGAAPGPAPLLPPVPSTRRAPRLPAHTTSSALREMEALRPPSGASGDQGGAADGSGDTAAGSPNPQAGDDGVLLVRRLRSALDTLFGVPETAEIVISDAVQRARADAGALLVPDDGAWRVAAGIGLRPLEHRYELDTRSWVIQEVARAHLGVIVEESDIARDQLQGAPLASWRHLVVAPVAEVEAVILLARKSDPPFDEADLASLAALGEEAGPLLAAALDTRSLARELSDFRDQPDLPH
jgi:hypothetical protein